MKTEPIIQFKHVTFSYGSSEVVHDLSFTVHAGEYVGLIGPNGGGKTTALKLLLGTLKADSGEILLFGKPIHEVKERYLVGYVPQRVAKIDLQFPATIEEVVRSGRTARIGVLKQFSAVDRQAVEDALAVAGIDGLRTRRVGELSGGQRQRVFIAQALASEPKILILDEPTVGVDVSSQEAFYSFLEEMNRTLGMTILLVSHDIEMVAKDITSLLCLNNTLIAHGTPEEVMKEENLAHLYGSKVVHVNHHHDHA